MIHEYTFLLKNQLEKQRNYFEGQVDFLTNQNRVFQKMLTTQKKISFKNVDNSKKIFSKILVARFGDDPGEKKAKIGHKFDGSARWFANFDTKIGKKWAKNRKNFRKSEKFAKWCVCFSCNNCTIFCQLLYFGAVYILPNFYCNLLHFFRFFKKKERVLCGDIPKKFQFFAPDFRWENSKKSSKKVTLPGFERARSSLFLTVLPCTHTGIFVGEKSVRQKKFTIYRYKELTVEAEKARRLDHFDYFPKGVSANLQLAAQRRTSYMWPNIQRSVCQKKIGLPSVCIYIFRYFKNESWAWKIEKSEQIIIEQKWQGERWAKKFYEKNEIKIWKWNRRQKCGNIKFAVCELSTFSELSTFLGIKWMI